MNFIQKILYLPDYLSGYGMGDPKRNGECKFLRNFVKDGMVIFDVGANVGEYSEYAIQYAMNLEIHAFEPVAETFDELKRRINLLSNKSKIYFNNFGLSNSKDEKEIFLYGKFAGVNSLYHLPVDTGIKSTGKVKILLNTCDEYVTKMHIEKIDLLKIDVEGHELKVLEGASETLNKGIIKCIQFEYGGAFINSGSNLGEVFGLLKKYNFSLYRIAPYYLIKVKSFTQKLENYKHSNWIAKLNT